MAGIEKEIIPEIMWPTPTLRVKHKGVEDFNKALAAVVKRREKEVLSRSKPTKVAGQTQGLGAHWLEYNVLNWDDPEIVQFRKMVLSGLREFFKMVGDPDDPGMKITGISCWANIVRYGDALEVHNHDPAFASAHYQVQSGYEYKDNRDQPGGLADSGHTVYFRPGFLDRSQGGLAAGPTSPWDHDWHRSVRPQEGSLFVFPSYVRHEVRPYLGHEERISIAMDVFIAKQQVQMFFGGPRWFIP